MSSLIIDEVKNGIHLKVEVLDEQKGRRLALAAFAARSPAALANPLGKPELQGFSQVHLTGENQAAHHGGQHQGSNAGGVLRYQSHAWGGNASGETLTVGGATFNAFMRFVADYTDQIVLGPGGVLFLWNPIDGYDVAAGGGGSGSGSGSASGSAEENLTIDPGSATITYDIVLIGDAA